MYDVKKILSKSTYNNLARVLNICRVCQPSRKDSAYNDLRTELGELFSIKTVSLYPKDVLVDLAETIQDLHIEKNDLKDYLYHTEKYLQIQLRTYRKNKDEFNRKANWERGKNSPETMKSLDKIDLIYLANSHNRGYHKKKNNMYRLLLSLIRQMDEEGIE